MKADRLARVLRCKLRRSRFLQILILTAVWLLGELLVRSLHLPVSGGVVGLFLLLALFATGKFKTRNLRRGAELLLSNLLLFFLPAVSAVLYHRELFGWLGIKALIVVLAGTIIVMVVTALVVEACFRLMTKRQPIGPGNAGEAQP
jgi:holin-like protein